MKDILLVFGEGGHAEQMKRLLHFTKIDPNRCVSLVDRAGISTDLAKEEWAVPPLRGKHSWSYLSVLIRLINMFFTVLRIYRGHKIKTLISTGPGISIVPAFVLKLLGIMIVHIETWSRFESRSTTGRIMYYIANKFYVQNKSLLRFYPGAIYSGRL